MKPDELVDMVARQMTSLDRAPELRARVVSRLPRVRRRDWRWIVAPIGVAALLALALALWLPRGSAPRGETQTNLSAGAEIVTPAVEPARAGEAETAASSSEAATPAQVPERLAAARSTAPASDRLSASAASMNAFEEAELPDENATLIPTLPLLASPEPLVVAVAPAEALAMPMLAIAPIPASTLVIPPLAIAALPGARPDGAL
jgi:cytoskeletal protein RodZ